jgi:hypothetical protein
MTETNLPATSPDDILTHVSQVRSDAEARYAKAQEDGKKLRDQAEQLRNSAPKKPA